MPKLYRRFDELVAAPGDDPRVPRLAQDMANAVPPEFAALVEAVEPGEVNDHPLGAVFVGDLPPVQAEVIRRLYRYRPWSQARGAAPRAPCGAPQ